MTLADARREQLDEVDCVLLDLDLPDAHGLAALHQLKTDRAELAVLVLTGFDDERRGVEAVAAGAQDYLVKGQIDGQGLARASATRSSAGAPRRPASSSSSRACTRRRTPASSAACFRRRWSPTPSCC